jgi:hypothetical protein
VVVDCFKFGGDQLGDSSDILGVMEKLLSQAKGPVAESFQSSFSSWFPNIGQAYQPVKTNKLVEIKAMMIVVSFMMLPLDMDSLESELLIPFVRTILDSHYFKPSFQALAAILFGFAKHEVSNGRMM